MTSIPPNADASAVADKTRPLRVLLVLDTRAWAGTESHVLTLARALRALGEGEDGKEVEVSLAVPPDSPLAERARQNGLAVVPIARRGVWDLGTLGVLTRRLRRGATDVVHVHNGRTQLWGTLAVRLARRGACVATLHFIAPAHSTQSGLKGRLSSAAHRFIERGIARHIAISGAVARAFAERSDVPADNVHVVFNGIETGARGKRQEAGGKMQEARGEGGANSLPDALPPELRAEVVCVARLQKEKDVPTLVRAMALLNAGRAEPVRCVVAGEGDERADLESLIAQHPACNVHLAGFTPHVAALLEAAKVAVLASPAEPFGLALLEAMAHAKPVVAINAGGPPEIVLPGETGLLVPPGDAPAMAGALAELLADPKRAQSMGRAGRARLEELFTAPRMASQTAQVYFQARRVD